jgi:hypothetical protein
MSSIDEKRVYSATEEKTEVFVATDVGVARVECSGDLVGGFGLVQRCSANDIAASGDRLAVATDEDVLVWNGNENVFEQTGFGPASAVGYHDTLIGAGEGLVAQYIDSSWNTLGDLDDVRAIDGDLLAATSGVFRSGSNGIFSVGLDDARDVSTATIPLVATAHGLYQLANGWVDVLGGDVSLVASDGRHTHAVADEALYVRGSESDMGENDVDENEWKQVEIPVEERIAGIAYGTSGAIYASTVDSTFLVGSSENSGNREGDENGETDENNGWYTRSLGLPDVCGLAVP